MIGGCSVLIASGWLADGGMLSLVWVCGVWV